MRVRKPTFDFSNTPAHWSKNAAFAQFFNAASVGIPSLERFLNRTMTAAGSQLDKDNPTTEQLKRDIKTFIRQEATHYTNHGAFNEMLTRHYPRIPEFEEKLAADFDRFSKTKSIAFLCAYCDGFETTGPPGALMWLDDLMPEYTEGADPEVMRLWKWHLMEEFEHRTVAYDVFKAVHGGYLMRVYGLIFHLIHFHGYVGQVFKYMLECDRATMREEEIRDSKTQVRKMRLKMLTSIGLGVLNALSPFYTPRKASEPVNFQSYMKKVEEELDENRVGSRGNSLT